MAVYVGTLSLVGEIATPVEVRIEVTREVLKINAAGSSIGEWRREDVAVREESDGFHLFAEGEEMIFRTRQDGFIAAVQDGPAPTSSIGDRIKTAASTPADVIERRTPPVQSADQAGSPAVTTSSNGMAVAALVLGVVGVLTGLVPLLGLLAIVVGILGVVFGVVGRRKVERGETVGGKAMATWGLGLGTAAIVLGFVGLVILGAVFNEVGQDLEDLSEELENFGRIDNLRITLDGCTTDGATGTVVNGHDTAVDVSVEVFFYDASGTQVDSSFDFVSGVRPGRSAVWEAFIFGTSYQTCEATISSAFES